MKNNTQILKTAILSMALLFAAVTMQAQGKGNSGSKGKPEANTPSGVKGKSDDQGKPEDKGKPESVGKPQGDPKGNANAEDHGKPGDKGKPVDGVKGNEDHADDDHGKEETHGKPEEMENQGQGNAYGKNKGDLEGREFGQARAAEARAKTQDKVKSSEQVLEHATQTEQLAVMQITTIKEQVANEVKTKTITAQAAEAVNTKVSEVEAKIKALQEAEAAHKALIEKVKAEMSK